MEYYLKTKTIEQTIELEFSTSKGDKIDFNGNTYTINNIRIVEPNKGIIFLECDDKPKRKRPLIKSIPRDRI
ncbi:hypothetical protein BFP78_15340 [Gaetbulibacter sp. 5U11]|nr:hypothetical protein BFP78_15340 [Gaetbulibacter sp. 5U11]